MAELSGPPQFESFEKKPLGSASLGQVHLATLRGGKAVAVKVQRPGIRQQIVEDLDSLGEIAEFLDTHTEADPEIRASG